MGAHIHSGDPTAPPGEPAGATGGTRRTDKPLSDASPGSQLDAAEGQTSALLAAASAGVLEIDLDGVIRAANPSVTAMMRLDRLDGRRLEDLVVPGDRDNLRDGLGLLTSGRRDELEVMVRFRGATGARHLQGLISFVLVRDPRGAPVRIIALVVDHTTLDDALHTASTEAERASAVLRAMPDGIIVCPRDGVILEVNHQVEEVFGYTSDELVGRPIETLVPSDRVEAHRSHRSAYAARPHATPMITGPGISGLTKDGATIPIEVNLAEVSLSTGPVIVAAIRDVTISRRTSEQLRQTHELVAGILAAATEQAIITVDLDGNIDMFSPGAERLLGWAAEEVLGTPASRFNVPDLRPHQSWGLDLEVPLAERVRALISSQVAATRPWVYQSRSGERLSVLLSVTVRQGTGGPTGLIIVGTDQTARLRQDQVLAESEERFRLAFDNAPVGVALISAVPDTVGTFLKVNGALVGILGVAETDLLGATVQSITHVEDLPSVVATLGILTDGTVATSLLEHRLSHADGHAVWAEVSISLIRDRAGEPDYFVAQIADITERKRAEAELTFNALHDNLTGLPNRLLLTERLTQALARAERNGSTVGVLYLDLDNFKDINDSLGHAAGDELLVAIALRLSSTMRDSDTAGRLGGDEFVIICEDLTSLDEVTAVADRVNRALAVQLPVAGRLVMVSASVGIAHSTDPADRAEDLLRTADIAMYRAKSNGRARYEHSDPELQIRAIRQLELESDLRETLDAQTSPQWAAAAHGDGNGNRKGRRRPVDDQLHLAYQPCFDAGSGRMVAVEALIRWNHPSRGLLGPGQFLDVAEDRALMVPLGLWVLRTACEQGAAWATHFGDAAPELWVNVSTRQLGRTHFASSVAEVLRETGMPAGKLCIELTERQALSTAHSALEDVNALPQLGVRLAIDDFGTGYAGFDYLRRLPVSTLKIDASYVSGVGTDATSTALVSSVINLGSALGLTVVAEGVETTAQQAAVTELGAHILQGFLLARPDVPGAVDAILVAQLNDHASRETDAANQCAPRQP